jgi:hypothetical protein
MEGLDVFGGRASGSLAIIKRFNWLWVTLVEVYIRSERLCVPSFLRFRYPSQCVSFICCLEQAVPENQRHARNARLPKPTQSEKIIYAKELTNLRIERGVERKFISTMFITSQLSASAVAQNHPYF